MNVVTIILYVVFAIILFFLLNFLLEKEDKRYVKQMFFSLAYIIFLAAFFKKSSENIFLVIVLELVFRIFWTVYVEEKSFVKNNKNRLKVYVFTIVLAYMINIYFINEVKSVLPTGEELRLIFWLFILLYFYRGIKEYVSKLETTNKDFVFYKDREYVVMSYAKLKNKYYASVKSKYKNLVFLIYAIMVYENCNKSEISRKLDYLRYKLFNQRVAFGIMQIDSNKEISDEESIKISIKKLEKIYSQKSKSKNIKKDALLKQILKEYYHRDMEEIIDIYNLIVEFDKR